MVKIGLFQKLKKLPKKKLIFILVPVVLAVLLISYFILREYRSDDDVLVFNPNEVVTHSVDRPSEKEPEDFEVPADIPKRIYLKDLMKDGYIQMVGIDQYDQVAVPSNVHMAGWYVNSVRPGQEGLSIMTGHRDGVMTKGIFRYLENSKVGDTIEIEYGDGSMRYFEVIDIKEVSIEDAYDLMYERVEGIDIQLNLITCSGRYNRRTRTYDNRAIVISKGI